jgi:hypothetical protein
MRGQRHAGIRFRERQTCTYTYNVNLKDDFTGQVNLNGSGRSVSFGLVKPYFTTYLAKHWCELPEGGSSAHNVGNTFVKVPAVDGSCNTTFSDGVSLATNPGPNADPNQWKCSDSVLLVNTSDANHSVRLVQDFCPICSGEFGGSKWPGTVGHIDAYNNLQFCKKRDPNNIDLGSFFGIRLR